MEEFASKKEDDFEFEFELGNGTKLIFPAQTHPKTWRLLSLTSRMEYLF
jgi:hypothetical protein